MEQSEIGTSRTAAGMWEATHKICATRCQFDRTVLTIRYFGMPAQEQYQKWFLASETVSSLLLKSSGHAPTEVEIVGATQKTWCENVELTMCISVENIADLKEIDMAQYSGQKEKFRDVCGSGEGTDEARGIDAACRKLRAGDGDGCIEDVGGHDSTAAEGCTHSVPH